MEFYTASFGHASGNFGTMVSLDGGLTWQASANGETSANGSWLKQRLNSLWLW